MDVIGWCLGKFSGTTFAGPQKSCVFSNALCCSSVIPWRPLLP